MSRPMRILHCFRAPLGGLFRHVCDLVHGQAAAGFEVGILCDENTGGENARDVLQSIEHICALGVHRIAMPRLISAADISAVRRLSGLAEHFRADVLHGHGAKGGAYARIAAAGQDTTAVYTPHGGSLHYSWTSPAGLLFLSLEKFLTYRTDGLIFESAYSHDAFAAKIAAPKCATRIIPNGLRQDEFATVPLDAAPADFLFVGELRHLKGVDVLLRALAEIKKDGRGSTAVIVGSGPDEMSFKTLARDLGISDSVRFAGPMPAREAFSLGRVLVVPSRAESFPYIVLEAAAAYKPIIATRVGGIPEIFGPAADKLIAPDNVDALRQSLHDLLHDTAATNHTCNQIAAHVADLFTVNGMVSAVSAFYGDIRGRSAEGIANRKYTTAPAE